MKRNLLIVPAIVLSGILGLGVAEAGTVAYEDSGQCSLGMGVIGGKYTGDSSYAAAVVGQASSETGHITYGVFGQTKSSSGMGVTGYAQASGGITYGVSGISDSTSGTGVYGYAGSSSGVTKGVFGRSDSTSGMAVYGLAVASSGANYGVFGQSASPDGTGVHGYAVSKTGVAYGVMGQSDSTSGTGVRGIAAAATGVTYGVLGRSMSTSGKGVYGYASAATGNGVGVYGYSKSPSGYGVYSKGRMHVVGNFTATGSKSAVVGLESGEGVTLYAVEASENWFEDAGSAKLENGRTVVHIDPIFSRTVDTKLDYHVFLTPEGDCKGLFVTQKGESSFEVRELSGGTADIHFSFRIMAKRRGYEGERLARVNMTQMTAVASPVAETEPAREDQ